MKKLIGFLGVVLCGMLFACGSDSSSNANENATAGEPSAESSGAVEPGSGDVTESSSSAKSDESLYDAASNTLTDLRDGQTYKTVTIGNQTWMASNLNYAYVVPTADEDSSSFCYGNEPDSCARYGRLYLWSAAVDSAAVFSDGSKDCGYVVSCSAVEPFRGVCPKGWHLPSMDEWSALFEAVGGKDSAGFKLKSSSGWFSGGVGVDSFGFSALPAGFRSDMGSFEFALQSSEIWSSTQKSDGYHAIVAEFGWSEEIIYLSAAYKNFGYSVRCLKDAE